MFLGDANVCPLIEVDYSRIDLGRQYHAGARKLKLNTLLGLNALLGIWVLYFLHFGNQIGKFHQLWFGVSACQNNMKHFGLVF